MVSWPLTSTVCCRCKPETMQNNELGTSFLAPVSPTCPAPCRQNIQTCFLFHRLIIDSPTFHKYFGRLSEHSVSGPAILGLGTRLSFSKKPSNDNMPVTISHQTTCKSNHPFNAPGGVWRFRSLCVIQPTTRTHRAILFLKNFAVESKIGFDFFCPPPLLVPHFRFQMVFACVFAFFTLYTRMMLKFAHEDDVLYCRFRGM